MEKLTVDFCKQKPSFLVGKLKSDGGIDLSQPIVYDGLFAKHTLYGSKTASHPSKLVKTQWKSGGFFSSLVTGENGVNYMNRGKLNTSLKNSGFMVNMEVRKKQKIVGGILKNVSNEILKDMERKYNVRLDKNALSVLSTNSSGSAPSVATYTKLMKTIQRPNAPLFKDFKGSPLEYKRILDYFQFTLVETVNSDKNLVIYRPNSRSIFNSIREGGNIKSAIKKAYDTSDTQNIRWYNKAIFATTDRPACMASIIRNIDTVYAKRLPNNGANYYRLKSSSNNIENIKKLIELDLVQEGIDIDQYILKDKSKKLEKNRGPYEYFLDREKFVNSNNIVRTIVLFYWMFHYPGDNEKILLRYFISLIDTYHDFTGGRAINRNKGGFTNLWPSEVNVFTNKSIPNYNTNRILVNNSPFLTKILGKDIYKRLLSRGQVSNTNADKAKRIVASQNRTSSQILSDSRKLADLLYFFINLLSVNNNLIRKIEDYMGGNPNVVLKRNRNGQIIGTTRGYEAGLIPRMVTEMTGSTLCSSLDSEDRNTGNKTALVIDIFTSRQAPCIVARSVVHDAGILDPAMGRKALSWGQVLDVCGTKSYPATRMNFTDRGQNNRTPSVNKTSTSMNVNTNLNVQPAKKIFKAKRPNKINSRQVPKVPNKKNVINLIKNNNNNNNKLVKKQKIIQPELRTAAMGAARANKQDAKTNLMRQIRYYNSKVKSGTGTYRNMKVWKERLRDRRDQYRREFTVDQ